jgi:hypothetical protein
LLRVDCLQTMRRRPGVSRFALANALALRVGAQPETTPNITVRALAAVAVPGREECEYG